MKKSLLALAVLGAFAGAASAQSSVTIYGIVDLALMKANDGTASNPGVPQAAGNDSWHVAQSAGSRLGFRGNEDLGGGLSAQFQIEHRFNPDTGTLTNTAVFWQGRSYVQLTSAAAGAVYLGREYTPAFWPAVKSDPFGWDGVGQIGSQAWAGYLTPNVGGVRSANTVGYKSPNLGGLTVQAAVGLGEGPGAGRTNGFNVEYGAGPLYGGFGYEKVTGDGAPADGNGVINFALHYDFGVAKLMGYYARSKVGPEGDLSNKIFTIGARVPVGAGVLKAAYYNRKDDSDAGGTKYSKIGIGYDYFLSKRTNVYVDAGFAKQDDQDNRNAFSLGLKHTF